MLSDAFTAFAQIFSPRLRGVLLKAIALAVGLLIVLAIGLNVALNHLVDIPSYPWLETTLAIVAGLGIVLGALYLVPAVSSLVAGLFLDDVADAVERASYPGMPPGTPQPIARSLAYTVRFFLIVLAVNLCALMLLLVPGVNIVIFFIANAYLLSREYFELAAMRHGSPAEARALRQANAVTVFLAGLLIAPLLMVPVLNLVTPIYGTAFMVHLHKRLAGRRRSRLIEGA
ncbi:sulfate transporter family protein [Aquabacter spiritensis]|uniref:CysZ protein n=1 Tax=Aquabacter spiritensis TaxID=933073 RepID=A0A4R3LX42_9HYPH|nr:sulfate transporter family protein [Aquabacter spiritensis]TCT05172.1 CysZ protein [Aquabacter spiritensis]